MQFERYDTVCLNGQPTLLIQCMECKSAGKKDPLTYTFPYERKQHIRILPVSAMRKHDRKHSKRKSLR